MRTQYRRILAALALALVVGGVGIGGTPLGATQARTAHPARHLSGHLSPQDVGGSTPYDVTT